VIIEGGLEYTIDFGGDPLGVSFTTSGRADLSTILRANEEFLSDPRFRPGMPILADHSALDTTPLESSDMEVVGQAYRKFLDQIGESPIAIVVAGPGAFGLIRMAGAHAGEPAPDAQIFYSRDEAVSWLRNPRDPVAQE